MPEEDECRGPVHHEGERPLNEEPNARGARKRGQVDEPVKRDPDPHNPQDKHIQVKELHL